MANIETDVDDGVEFDAESPARKTTYRVTQAARERLVGNTCAIIRSTWGSKAAGLVQFVEDKLKILVSILPTVPRKCLTME